MSKPRIVARALDVLRRTRAQGLRGTYRPMSEAVPRLAALHRQLAVRLVELAERAPTLQHRLLLSEAASRLEVGADTLDRAIEDSPNATRIMWMQYTFLIPVEQATERLLHPDAEEDYDKLVCGVLQWFRAAEDACQNIAEGVSNDSGDVIASIAQVERRHAMELSDSWAQADIM